MQTFTDSTGNQYPVSDATPITDPDGWTSVDSRKTKAKWQAGGELTVRERQWLTAQTNRQNMQRVVAFLDGRPFTDVGPTLDAVHGQTWEPDTCGCKVSEVFNHLGGDQRELKSHKTHRQCAHHAALASGETHYAEVKAENSHKNQSVRAIAEALGVDVSDVKWSHDDTRQLVIKHTKLKGQDKVRAQAALNGIGGNRRIKLEE